MKALSLTLLLASLAAAQTPKAVVTGTGSFTSFVEDMDRTLAFYHEAFGMEVPALPAPGQRPYNPANPQLFKFFDIAGAKERHQSARIPNTRVTVEIMEIQQVAHQTHALRVQDPGAAGLVFLVGDVDAVLARAVQAKAAVATPGGKPVAFPDGSRAVLIRDIDGRFIELRQVAAGGDIADMRVSLAVNDLDATLRAYRDVLGFKVEGETKFTADAAMRSLTGLAKAEVRRARVQAPGSQLWIELAEYRGVDRKPLVMKIQDRGAARLQLRVQDTDAVTAAAKAAGLKIMSEGGIAQPIPPNFKGVLIADPNYFFLTPFAPCDGCAPTIGGGTK
ncbi:MAG: hypothetical protein RL328_390 [Acidobacteriota bacterium]|jgi:catechol 2,3-dioxygenase-like lactoylglutathione lyase family enzyme